MCLGILAGRALLKPVEKRVSLYPLEESPSKLQRERAWLSHVKRYLHVYSGQSKEKPETVDRAHERAWKSSSERCFGSLVATS